MNESNIFVPATMCVIVLVVTSVSSCSCAELFGIKKRNPNFSRFLLCSRLLVDEDLTRIAMIVH